MDVTRLKVLIEVARRGSMTAAALALSYTPSAVSQQIRKLEQEAGQPVLDRHARGVTLTDAGRAMVEHGLAVERQLEALRERLDEIAGLRAGSLRIGTFPTVGASLLPLAVTRFRTAHPQVELSVQSARLAGLLDLLANRQVEIALLWDYEWSRISDPALELTPLLDDPTALVVAASHPLADRPAVDLRDLADEPWITRADEHPVAEVLHRSARQCGFTPSIAFEAHDYQEAQAMVAVGLGVALAPRLALTSLRDDVRVLSLGRKAPTRRITLARLAGRRAIPAEAAMSQVLVHVGREVAATL